MYACLPGTRHRRPAQWLFLGVHWPMSVFCYYQFKHRYFVSFRLWCRNPSVALANRRQQTIFLSFVSRCFNKSGRVMRGFLRTRSSTTNANIESHLTYAASPSVGRPSNPDLDTYIYIKHLIYQ
ncbi:hypothetical protein F4859DRAFT_289490 [Xylaria cf. heliscus]|nr:hypothetical protein F4859DRAFT_289490 [Xylaria cf. heliscus]